MYFVALEIVLFVTSRDTLREILLFSGISIVRYSRNPKERSMSYG